MMFSNVSLLYVVSTGNGQFQITNPRGDQADTDSKFTTFAKELLASVLSDAEWSAKLRSAEKGTKWTIMKEKDKNATVLEGYFGDMPKIVLDVASVVTSERSPKSSPKNIEAFRTHLPPVITVVPPSPRSLKALEEAGKSGVYVGETPPSTTEGSSTPSSAQLSEPNTGTGSQAELLRTGSADFATDLESIKENEHEDPEVPRSVPNVTQQVPKFEEIDTSTCRFLKIGFIFKCWAQDRLATNLNTPGKQIKHWAKTSCCTRFIPLVFWTIPQMIYSAGNVVVNPIATMRIAKRAKEAAKKFAKTNSDFKIPEFHPKTTALKQFGHAIIECAVSKPLACLYAILTGEAGLRALNKAQKEAPTWECSDAKECGKVALKSLRYGIAQLLTLDSVTALEQYQKDCQEQLEAAFTVAIKGKQ